MSDQEWEELYRKTERRMKKAFKIVLGTIVTVIIIIALLWMSFVYRTEYKIATITTSISPDGTHELILQAVGEAAWPFGPANGRLILMEKQKMSQLYAKYAEVLKLIMQEHKDPNGRVYNVDERWEFENNTFAILDVDGDGRQELVFNFNTGNLGSMCEVIYDYDAKQDILREELAEWVDTTYYSNGFIKVSDSHNHGKDPEQRGIWPYTLYQYDVSTDSYQLQYHVTSWDGQINSENFPSERDTDGDGVLYYILEDDKTIEDADVQPMNRQEYDNWVKETLPEGCLVDVTYHPMTEESIQKYLENSYR